MIKSKEPEKKFTSDELVHRIRARYDDPARYAVFTELGNGTGYRNASWIDVAVVSLWPSDGLGIDAYEVKISRSDFTRELLDAGKNKWCRDQLSSFSYVVAPGVWKDDGLPEGAGLYVAHGDGLKLIKAPARFDRTSYSPALMAALARASKKSDKAEERLAREAYYRNDAGYQNALAWRAAGTTFLSKRGQYRYSMDRSSESLAAAFELAALDKDQLEAKQLVERRLESFRNRLMEVFGDWAVLSQIAILEIDKTGDYVMDSWGSKGKEVAKGRHAKKLAKDDQARKDEEDDYLARVVSERKQQRENPLATDEEVFSEDLDDEYDGLESERPDRIERNSPPGETAPGVWAGLAKDVVTKPLTPTPEPSLCPQCGKTADICPCAPELP